MIHNQTDHQILNILLLEPFKAVAQTIFYAVTLAITLLLVLLMNGPFFLQSLFVFTQEPSWLLIPTWPLAIVGFIFTLAESTQAPFAI